MVVCPSSQTKTERRRPEREARGFVNYSSHVASPSSSVGRSVDFFFISNSRRVCFTAFLTAAASAAIMMIFCSWIQEALFDNGWKITDGGSVVVRIKCDASGHTSVFMINRNTRNWNPQSPPWWELPPRRQLSHVAPCVKFTLVYDVSMEIPHN